jgi:hypothetical protein
MEKLYNNNGDQVYMKSSVMISVTKAPEHKTYAPVVLRKGT